MVGKCFDGRMNLTPLCSILLVSVTNWINLTKG